MLDDVRLVSILPFPSHRIYTQAFEYDRPSDTTAVVQGKTTLAEVHRLLYLALIAHKYQFMEIERWARTYLELHCSTPATHPYIHFPKFCTNEALAHLVRYAVIVESRPLREAALKSIQARVSGEQQHRMGLVEALNIGDTFGLRSLQGELYYRILCDACRSMAIAMGPTEVMTFSKFRSHLPSDTSELQKDRLVQGYFTLIAVKDKVFESIYGNMNMSGRSDIALADLGHDRKVSVDILGRIDQLLVARPLDSVRTQLVNLYFEVKEAIPDYFLGKQSKA